MAAQCLGYNSPDGTVVVSSSSELLHLYGGTPVDQPAAVTSVTTTGADSTTNAYGYTTAAQADAVVASLNALIARCREIGVIAT